MNFFKIIVGTFLLIIVNFTQAQEVLPGLKTNGCGTDGIQGVLVPDSTLFSRCQFHNSCNKHDLCYGRCLKGGDLFGKETCNDPIAKESRRASCDTNFFNNIVEDNNDRAICKVYGKFYRLAVVKFGKGNFAGKEIEELAKLAFSKGEIEAENIYRELSKIQNSNFSPQKFTLDRKNNVFKLNQNDLEIKFSKKQIEKMANKQINKD